MTRKEILFEGHFYDVTDFIQKHPGGTVIEYYTEKGEDSTHAIQQFHNRSAEKVRLMMKALKKRPASDSEIGLNPIVLKRNSMITEDFTKLHLQLKDEGYFEPSYWQGFVRLMEVFTFFGIGLKLCFNQSFVVQIFGVVLMALARARAAFLVHEFGHYSYSGNIKIDQFMSAIIQGVFVGLSVARWRRQHNRHHAMPQRLHYDVDLETMPLLAYNKKAVKKPEDGSRFNIRYQAHLFVLNTLFVAILWQFYQDPKFILKYKKYLEMFAVAAHCVLFYSIGFWPWFFSTWGGSFYMLLTFSMNHTFLPVTTEPTHWVEYSLLHTADVEHAPWCDWAMGYLNYQIEHHLFPTMPNFRLPYIKDRVQKLAEKHNIPYILHSYPEAMYKVFKNLSDVAKEMFDGVPVF